ncbi:Lipid III flippase [compost metagenome]
MQPSDEAQGSLVKAKRNSFIYSAALTTSAHLSKIVIGFIVLKLIAIYLGVDGMGQLGNFMSAVSFLSLLAGGGVVNGVIKYVAEYKVKPRKLIRFISAARTYSFIICSVFCVGGVVFSSALSEVLFKSGAHQWIIVFLAFAQFGFAFTNLVTGTANGLRDTKAYALIQVIGNVLVLPVAWALIRFAGVPGAAISIVLMFLLYAVPAAFFYWKSPLRKRLFKFNIDGGNFKKLSSYSLMAGVGAISVPLVEIVVREAIISNAGYTAAGIWQASIKLSSAYMGFFIVFMAAYFMPTISAQENKAAIVTTVKKFMALVMCLFIVGGGSFYLLREWMIPLLLSSEFSRLGTLIQYQLIGDFLRVSTYVIGFVVVAKAALRIYLCSEILQGILFSGLSLAFLKSGQGLEGVFFAHVLMNVVYFCCSLVGFYIYSRRGGV